MNSTLVDWLLALAGMGCLTLAIAHSVLGERRFVKPIIKGMDWSAEPVSADLARRTVWLAWHVTSLMWLGAAAILVAPVVGLHGALPAYAVGAATFGAAFLMGGFGTRWRHRAWPIFAVITLALSAATIVAGAQ